MVTTFHHWLCPYLTKSSCMHNHTSLHQMITLFGQIFAAISPRMKSILLLGIIFGTCALTSAYVAGRRGRHHLLSLKEFLKKHESYGSGVFNHRQQQSKQHKAVSNGRHEQKHHIRANVHVINHKHPIEQELTPKDTLLTSADVSVHTSNQPKSPLAEFGETSGRSEAVVAQRLMVEDIPVSGDTENRKQARIEGVYHPRNH